jgi:hypothetical protein
MKHPVLKKADPDPSIAVLEKQHVGFGASVTARRSPAAEV